MKRNTSQVIVRSGNAAVYVTGKLAKTITIGLVVTLLMFGIAALIEAVNNRSNLEKLNP